MRKATREIVLGTDVDTAWRFLADFANDPLWRPELREMVLVAGDALHVGATYREVTDWQGVPIPFTFHIDELLAPSLIRFSGSEPGVVSLMTYRLEPHAEGTLLKFVVEVELFGPLAALEPFAWSIILR